MIEYQVITEVNKNGFGMVVDHLWKSKPCGTLFQAMWNFVILHVDKSVHILKASLEGKLL